MDWKNAQIGAGLGGGLGGIAGGLATLFGVGGSGGDKQRQQAVLAWQNLQAVDFDLSKIPPADLQVLQEIRPDLVEMILPMQSPEIQDSIQGRGAMVRGLGRLEQYAQEGLPAQERGAIMDAQRQLGGQIQMGQEAVMRDLGERGRLGAGDEAAARMIAAQTQSDLAGRQGRDLASLISQNRMGAAGQAASLGQALRAGDINLSQARAQQSERYNQAVADILNQGALANQAARQGAQAYNVGQRNEVLGIQKPLNVQQTAQANIANTNALRQMGYENKLEQLRGYSGALAGQANAEDIKRRNKLQAISSIGQGIGGIGGGILGGIL